MLIVVFWIEVFSRQSFAERHLSSTDQFEDEKPTGTRDYTEYLKVQYFKGQEIVHEYQCENSDQYEVEQSQKKYE